MKNTLIILAAIAFALVSCNEEILDNTPDETPTTQTSIVFNLTANHPDGAATKAIKTAWENGDVIYVFFNNVAAPKYLKMSYDGSKWSYTEMDGASTGSLRLEEGASGTMRAVYLPFGNTLTVGAGADGTSFTFSETTYSYYLTATLDYTVKDGKVSGAFNMSIPVGYVQFFLDDAGASSSYEIEIREPHLTPHGIASIAANGTITHTSIAHGAPLPGYVYDKTNKVGSDAKGYLFSGILAEGARNKSINYHFTLVSGGWQGTYYSIGFPGSAWYISENSNRAFKLPALSEIGWKTIDDYKPIDLGIDVGGKRIYWSSRNLGAQSDGPADNSNTYGDYYNWWERNDDFVKTFGSNSLWRVPTEPEWHALITMTNIEDIEVLHPGTDHEVTKWTYNAWDDTYKGLIVRNDAARETDDPYIFLPAAGQIENNQSKEVRSAAFFWSSSEPSFGQGKFYAKFYNGGCFVTNGNESSSFSIRPVSD